ncbi:MAG: GNAT family N-acetyltransferase [Dictyoglomus sp.]|nr:GNAT family N-acetyltransferase [Dictyoglomus sp.]MCX7845511.1 GNAT family N-acetyltransferase [Dictyoglomaceae bacterium]MDW8189306.1 GNAT family protein [Dictyoglomus sp.]
MRIFDNFPVLETPHLILRKISLSDAEDLFEYAKDKEITKYLSWEPHKSIEDSVRFIEFMLIKYEREGYGDWGIEFKENRKLIGTCGYVWWDRKNSKAEIGYVLSRKYWKRGLMTEAVKEIIKFGFEKMFLNRIQARCIIENIASERVMQKVGMKFEGILREDIFIRGNYWDTKLYSILRKEFFITI